MMNRKILLFMAGILATAGLFAQSGNLVGMVKNQGDGQAIPFASVQLFKDGKKAVATQSDIDGKYKLDKISPGSYSLKIKAVGYDSITISDVTINANRKLTMNIEVSPKQTRINEVIPIPNYVPKKHTPINWDCRGNIPEESAGSYSSTDI